MDGSGLDSKPVASTTTSLRCTIGSVPQDLADVALPEPTQDDTKPTAAAVAESTTIDDCREHTNSTVLRVLAIRRAQSVLSFAVGRKLRFQTNQKECPLVSRLPRCLQSCRPSRCKPRASSQGDEEPADTNRRCSSKCLPKLRLRTPGCCLRICSRSSKVSETSIVSPGPSKDETATDFSTTLSVMPSNSDKPLVHVPIVDGTVDQVTVVEDITSH